MPKLLKMKDKADNFVIKKDKIFIVGFRFVLVGSSGCGKTSALGSLITLNEFYNKDFIGTDIYIFSPMINDFKMDQIIKMKKIPSINIFQGNLDNEILDELYEKLVEEFKEDIDSKKKPRNFLIIIDDCSFDGSLRSGLFNSVSRLFCNGRKSNISCIITAQYISHILPVVLCNITGGIFYNMSDRNLDILCDHYNYTKSKRYFKELFREHVKEKHDHFIINFSNSRKEGIYLDKNFDKIDF